MSKTVRSIDDKFLGKYKTKCCLAFPFNGMDKTMNEEWTPTLTYVRIDESNPKKVVIQHIASDGSVLKTKAVKYKKLENEDSENGTNN